MVPGVGFEPTHLAASVFETDMSAVPSSGQMLDLHLNYRIFPCKHDDTRQNSIFASEPHQNVKQIQRKNKRYYTTISRTCKMRVCIEYARALDSSPNLSARLMGSLTRKCHTVHATARNSAIAHCSRDRTRTQAISRKRSQM